MQQWNGARCVPLAAAAVQQAVGQHEEGRGVALLSGFAEPLEGGALHAQLVLRLRAVARRRTAQPMQTRRRVLLGVTDALDEHNSNPDHRVVMAGLS
eukprot:scaffold43434_cov65-Phaeocystis_antarctica.AAC.2